MMVEMIDAYVIFLPGSRLKEALETEPPFLVVFVVTLHHGLMICEINYRAYAVMTSVRSLYTNGTAILSLHPHAGCTENDTPKFIRSVQSPIFLVYYSCNYKLQLLSLIANHVALTSYYISESLRHRPAPFINKKFFFWVRRAGG